MRLIGVFVCLAGLASGQAILEHAIAAGAGSVAGVAGKGINESVNRIFEKTRALVQRSEEAPAAPVIRQVPPQVIGTQTAIAPVPGVAASIPPLAGYSLPPAPGQRVAASTYWSRPVVPKKAKGKIASWELMPQDEAPEPERPNRPALTSEDIAKVGLGTTRDQLLASLGKPASRVMLPSDGALLEIYSYLSPSGPAGSIRLTDGTVSSVHPSSGSR